MEIYINYSFIAWIALLAFLAKKNANLSSLLIVMLIPKLFDLTLLTPVLQLIKSTDYRSLFFIIHALNDAFMIILIKYRWLISSRLDNKSIYRKLEVEKYIIAIYAFSILYNLLVFGDYSKVWEMYFGMPNSFFYTNYELIKKIITFVYTALLTTLTMKTLIAVKQLKQKGLID